MKQSWMALIHRRDQFVFDDSKPSPSFILVRQLKLPDYVTGSGIKPHALTGKCQIDPVTYRDKVISSRSPFRSPSGTEPAGYWCLPQNPSGVDVNSAQHVRPFDHQPSPGDLRIGTVSVPRQNFVMRRSAEPQNSQRCFDQFIVGNHAVARIAVLMRPSGRFRQPPDAPQQDDCLCG